ncbi:hypothetical protein PsYK624_162250 [Phanerochaete sordida]|uniref:DUF6533 domain-containing protein n=1 Tax=Phanerochaete sordida TaxID=48140 RepID=A0A9P3GVK0_9APHY|nr:hypothetical protein PsYK624_162250 [Phanerochaete sordida]
MDSSSLASLQNFRAVSYISVSTLALLVYDYLLTLESEVKLIWSSKWSLTKLLFFLTRYLAFVDVAMVAYIHVAHDVPQGMCKIMSDTVGWMVLWGIGVAELVVIVRTWAIWGRDCRIGLGLTLFWVVMQAVNSYTVAKFISSGTVLLVDPTAQNLRGCFLVTTKDQLVVDWVLVAALETIVLVLTLMKVARVPANGRLLARDTTSPLIRQLARDGVLFYVYLLGISLVNIVILLATSHELSTLLVCLQRALHSILSARLLLNLRAASIRSDRHIDGATLGETEWTRNRCQSSIHFNVPISSQSSSSTVDDDGL